MLALFTDMPQGLPFKAGETDEDMPWSPNHCFAITELRVVEGGQPPRNLALVEEGTDNPRDILLARGLKGAEWEAMVIC